MLNYAYVVEARRLARALTAIGLALPLGFLHSDKKGRNSFVWDAIEPLRPEIDARVFKFIASGPLRRPATRQSPILVQGHSMRCPPPRDCVIFCS